MKRSTTLLFAAALVTTTAAVVLNSKNHDLSRHNGSLVGQLVNNQYEMGRMEARLRKEQLLRMALVLPDQPPADAFVRQVLPLPVEDPAYPVPVEVPDVSHG